jgi:hypothetical protein
VKYDTLSPEQIKLQLKKNINLTDIRVSIKAVRILRDRGIIIETGSEEEINSLSFGINTKLEKRLELIKHKLRKPRLIIYNVSEEITPENVVAVIKAQNPGIITNGEDTEAKFRYKTRKGRFNIVMEVGPKTRMQILQSKLKTGWEICNVADYLNPIRCYKCSQYNHKHDEYRGEACPHCAGTHKMKECTATASEHKCINRITYNKYSYNKKEKINENQTALNKDCPSLKAVLTKFKDNTEC